MSLIPSMFGGRRSNVFDPFSLDVWDPFQGFPFGGSSTAVTNAFPRDTETSAMVNARIDWKETPEAHVFKADMPGLKKEEVKVEVEDGRLLQISGERTREKEAKNDTWHRVERSSGAFIRRFRLPENAKMEEVKASMENGVLTVTVPKVEEKKPEVPLMDRSRRDEWVNNYKREWPLIIAMQGDPYTGKTMLANRLSEWLNYPVIRLEDILDALSPNSPEEAEAIVSQAFDLITRIVKTHTSLNFSVIVDSPLSRRSHLDNLVRLLTTDIYDSRRIMALSLLIVECKPSIQYTRQMRFEERDPTTYDKWYKTQKWPPDRAFVGRDYTDDDIHPLVSKLIVDTTKTFQIQDLCTAVHDLTAGPEGHRVELDKWKCIHLFRQKQHRPSLSSDRDEDLCRLHGHLVYVYMEEGISYDASCGVCQDQIVANSSRGGGVYACKSCPLAIHKSCAELHQDSQKVYFTPTTYPKFFQTEPRVAYCFPEEHTCETCREQGLDFSYDCLSCVFQCHMKCRLVPTVLHHPEHPHWLSLVIRPISSRRNLDRCNACCREMKSPAYQCSNRISAKCNVAYHPNCLLLPPFVREHKHGGYTHDLEMISHRDNIEFDDYICHLCFKMMRHESWYYCCKECHLEFHLDCAFHEFQ